MKIEAENTPDPAARKVALAESVGKNDTSFKTSVIPALGLTFTEADRKTTPPAGCEDRAWDEAADAAKAIHDTPPRTLGDVLVKLRVLAGPLGVAGGSSDSHARSIGQISAFLTPSGSEG